MRAIALILLVASLLGFGATLFVESSFLGRAIEVQPVMRDSHSDTGWKLSGPPQKFLGIRPTYFVTQSMPGIARQVDMDALRSDPNIVPYNQIEGTLHLARLGAMAAAFVALAALWWSRRRPIMFRTGDEHIS